MYIYDTNQILDCAQQLAEAADRLERAGEALEQQLLDQRVAEKTFFFFKKSTKDVSEMREKRERLVRLMRNQSLYLRECVRRYRGVQSKSVMRAGNHI